MNNTLHIFRSTLIGVAIGLTTVACTNMSQGTDRDPANYPQGPTRLHAVHSERLLETMQRISLLVRNRDAPVRQTDEWRTEYLQALIDSAGEVIVAAESMAADGQSVSGLDRNEQAVFHRLADRLYVETVNIELQARDSDFLELQASYDGLNETCNACHRLFRDR